MNTDKMKNLAVNDNGFVFDPSSGYSYSVNNEYWGPDSTSSGVGRDHEHPLQAFVQVPQPK